jgi:hypothetical protein
MRKKYNVFDISKINNKTISLAVTLKKEQEKTQSFEEASLLGDSNPNYAPYDKNALLEYLSVKYLHLKPSDGIPLIKQAFKMQYKVEDEYKKCKQCGRLFRSEKNTKVFCSGRCRQRFYRSQKKEVL